MSDAPSTPEQVQAVARPEGDRAAGQPRPTLDRGLAPALPDVGPGRCDSHHPERRAIGLCAVADQQHLSLPPALLEDIAAVRPVGLNGADIFKTYIQLNRTHSVAAKLARAAIAIPGVLEKGLREDHKKNLY